MKTLILTLIIWSSLIGHLFAQQFEFHSNTPFGIQLFDDQKELPPLLYMFEDMDSDNDMDLIVAGIDSINFTLGLEISFYLGWQFNVGSSEEPQFSPREYFEDFDYPNLLFLPTVGDLDGDGLIDIVAGLEQDSFRNNSLVYYRNIGAQQFEKVDMTDMGIRSFMPGSIMNPKLMDLDNDGDLDLLMSGDYPTYENIEEEVPFYLYAKNIGTGTQPEFLGWFDQPYDLIPDEFTTLYTEGDVDNDGDVDLIGVVAEDEQSPLLFFENMPDQDGKPRFAIPVESPFGLPQTGSDEQFFSPVFTDIDSDGDLDFFVLSIADVDLSGELQFNGLLYYENSLITGTYDELITDLEIRISPNPTSDYTYIENYTTSTIRAIHIYRADGSYVRSLTGRFEEPVVLIDLTPDTYIFRIYLEEGEVFRKVVVMR